MDDTFQKLEEKLSKAVEVFRQTLAEKRALERELEQLRTDSKEHAKRVEAQERELMILRKEREEVRNRVENLLAQIDVLTKPESTG